MKKYIMWLLLPLIVAFKSNTVRTVSLLGGILITKEVKSQECDTSCYKLKSYIPKVENLIIAGTNYMRLDDKDTVEYPVYTWLMLQDKPDFKGVCYNALFSQLYDDVGLVYYEQQALAISGNTLSILNGTNTINSVIIPTQTTQTVVGSNGISISTGINTFTVSKTKRQETYSGTTDASGNYTVTFSTAYSVAPNIQANPIGGSTETFIKIVSISTTGFTINVFQRATVLSLALSTATNPVNGASVDVLITEK